MKKEEKIIMYDSPEAATYRKNIEGWVSSNGRFFGKDEHMARYDGSTHNKCECGSIAQKGYLKCDSCLRKDRIERYEKLPFKEYTGEPVFSWDQDQFFFSEDDIVIYMEENYLEKIALLCSEQNSYYEVANDYWADIMPEDSDGDLPDELQKALDNLNTVVKSLPPCSYSAGKIRTSYTLTPNK
ncbi:hypothetical protein J2O09_05535 [Elizabethkingia anophelis]|uniref:hypothetical protein n=1 Tax=Elizabethkingia anophelis TaxID=1117645 RepID=UPI0020B89339|nr:hypothetical protein [Elizabethkingia anophelis]UTG62418.1 hypothetical protein J2O09_05535 [Elizabethkingia anophelis]UXM68700.1 hypothetical protein N7E57_05545 [Elizabethkingia anophelis]